MLNLLVFLAKINLLIILVSWGTKFPNNISFLAEKLPYSQICGTQICTSYKKRRHIISKSIETDQITFSNSKENTK